MKRCLQTARETAEQCCVAHTIGIDLGDRWSRYCVVDGTGAILEEDRVRTTAEAITERFGRCGITRIVIEAGTHSP
jgi:hypothetical protein